MRLIDADAFDERVRVAGGMSEDELTDDFKDGVQAVLYMLSNQPTIQPEPHWIPVTERLPKPRESVIISVNGKYGDWIGEGCYWETTENHVIWKGYRWNATYWDDEIIAWMPLPEPFKGVNT